MSGAIKNWKDYDRWDRLCRANPTAFILREATKIAKVTLWITAFSVIGINPAIAQSRAERRQAQIEESAKSGNVAGGVKFQTTKSYQDSYEALLNWVKRADYSIESADKDIGQIVTGMTVTGRISQTGTRIVLTVIKESDSETTIKVAVTEQKRKKLLDADPWSTPKVNDKESQAVADKIKSVLR